MANQTPAIALAKMDYDVVRPLGTGAGSTILLIRDKKDGQRYALKVVRKQSAEDDIYINQAQHEFQVARMLDHPSLLKIYGCRIKRSWFRIVGVEMLMEYVDGRIIDEFGALSTRRLINAFRRVADAMMHMHRRGVYHGDLKPGNIMISRRGEVKVLDFGTAWIKGQDKGRVQGTPHYMAPEQAQRRVVNVKTDIYNLGATMYRMFTGEYANLGMPGLDNGQISRSRLSTPASLNAEIPLPLSALIMDCLEPRPDRRPVSMLEVKTRLDESVASLGRATDQSGEPESADA